MRIQSINIIPTKQKTYINKNKINFTSCKPIYSDYVPEYRAAFSQKNFDDFNKIYDNYYNSQNIISLSEIKDITDTLSNKYNCPKQLVLESMQALTQFGNINSVKIISKTLDKNNVHSLSNTKRELNYLLLYNNIKPSITKKLCNDNGIVNALYYLLTSKDICPTNNLKNQYSSIILDKYKIELLEKIKKDYPDEYNKIIKIPDIKYFYISGWDNGITFANRNKNLEQETENLLKKSLDNNRTPREELNKEYLARINQLGIKPIIIENNPLKEELYNNGYKTPYITTLTVFNQLKPNTLSKSTFFNIIESNNFIRNFTKNEKTTADKFDITAEYLNNYLKVYSPETLSIDLKALHKKIVDKVTSLNRTEDDILYVLPSFKIKSQHYINYCYQLINNVPPNKFVILDDINPKNLKNKILVYIDDSAFTGNSIIEVLQYDLSLMNCLKSNKIIFANLISTDEAINAITNTNNTSVPFDLVNLHTLENSKYPQSETLIKNIGETRYGDTSYATIYPYMLPDNNSELAICLGYFQNKKLERKISNNNQLNNNIIKYDIGEIPAIITKVNMLVGFSPIIKKKDN